MIRKLSYKTRVYLFAVIIGVIGIAMLIYIILSFSGRVEGGFGFNLPQLDLEDINSQLPALQLESNLQNNQNQFIDNSSINSEKLIENTIIDALKKYDEGINQDVLPPPAPISNNI